ncbi:hypothetical protein IFM89_019492 [Coptis chinensis]|uniref:F-box domain-containing protein n=1 Tax=Coptis chinensis TaxID=261450 RepID=A0A835GYD3_9MAGN|nr:hypothetical protein IFM89_019492 [Coptis chinensis]
MISTLPDPILHHILSFLEMRYVLQTCILSKRWNSLWTTLSFLTFERHTYGKTLPLKTEDEFMDYVHKVLLTRDVFTCIHTLRLSYFHVGDDAWLDIVVRRNIQELDLFIEFGYMEFELPYSLVNCKTLVVLKLEILLEQPDDEEEPTVFVELPESVNLPSLKKLVIRTFCFHGEEFMPKVLLNCPVLECLSIRNCGLHESDRLVVCGTQLKELEINGVFACEDNHYCEKICKIVVSAPLLKSFKCSGYIGNEYLLEDLSSLDKAEADMEVRRSYFDDWEENVVIPFGRKKRLGMNMVKFLDGISNAKSLTLSAWVIEVLPRVVEVHPTSFSARHLKVKTWLSKYSIQGIKYLLENSCNLETLIVEITKPKVKTAEIWESQEAAEVVSDYRFCKLRFVEIRNFQGYVNELELFKSMLKNAVALEKLTVLTSRKHSPDS